MAPRIGVVTFPGSLDDHDALRAVRLLLHSDDAVAAGLITRHRFDAEHARPMLLEVRAHLP